MNLPAAEGRPAVTERPLGVCICTVVDYSMLFGVWVGTRVGGENANRENAQNLFSRQKSKLYYCGQKE